MKRAVIKKACKWTTLDGGTVEMSSGYPLADLIELMIFSLSNYELHILAAKFNSELEKRQSGDKPS